MNDSASSALPDFCRLPRIAAVCGVAQLAVVLVFLSPNQSPPGSWQGFLFVSAFAQWLALAAALSLCKSRSLLSRFRPVPAYFLAALIPALITAIAAWLVYFLDRELGYGLTRNMSVGRFTGGIAIMVALLCGVLLRYFYVLEQWQEQVKAHAKASLQALQARINPHFLFNSMNTIAALVRRDPKTAETAIEDLSDLFRAALGDEQTESTLAQELQIARQYLAIEQLRLGARLRIAWQLADDLPMHCKMPRLLLQPLFENAVAHGVALLPEGGRIDFSAGVDGKCLQFEIRNPLAVEHDRPGLGHAQLSVQQRLKLAFGAQANVSGQLHGDEYVCRLRIPYA
jgi:two-component system, LytTR family, sensor histidine kinase AlgZ